MTTPTYIPQEIQIADVVRDILLEYHLHGDLDSAVEDLTEMILKGPTD